MKNRSFFGQRPLVWFALCQALGILFASRWQGFLFYLPLCGLCLSMLAAYLLWQGRGKRLLALGFCYFFLGCLLAGLALNPKIAPPGDYQVTGVVAGQVEASEDGRRLKAVLRDVRLEDGAGKSYRTGSAYWTWYPQEGDRQPMDGQRLRFGGRAYAPSGQSNPEGFDFQAYLLQRGIGLGITGAKDLQLEQPLRQEHQNGWLRVRLALAERMDVLFAAYSPLAKALLLGLRDDLSEQLNQDFREAGLAHILAVSGLHVSLLVFGLLRALKRFSLSPRWVLVIACSLMLMYCRLLDFSPSVVRACILSGTMLAARVMKRPADPLSSLALSLMLITLFRPLDLLSIGFQLSFLAVLGIFTLGDALEAVLARKGWYQRLPRPVQGLIQGYLITLSCSLMVLVPLVNTFNRLSLVGLLISPLACLLVGWLMLGMILSLLLSLISLDLAKLLAVIPQQASHMYQAGVSWSAHLPLASISLADVPCWLSASYYSCLLLLSRYALPGRRIKASIIGLLASLSLVLALIPSPQPLKYIQLSVGNADSAVILDGQTTWVIDAGEHGGDLASLLLSQGRRIDHLIISHLHMDHVGGLKQLLERRVDIGRILLPYGAWDALSGQAAHDLLAQAEALGIPIQSLGAGDELHSQRVSGKVLWPYHQAFYPGQNPNRGSLVVYWELDGVSLLSCGDISPDYFRYLARPSQVYKVPHHGGKSDNDPENLRLIMPSLALISASHSQEERHKALREDLGKLGVEWAVTGEGGALTLEISQGKLSLSTFLTQGGPGDL